MALALPSCRRRRRSPRPRGSLSLSGSSARDASACSRAGSERLGRCVEAGPGRAATDVGDSEEG